MDNRIATIIFVVALLYLILPVDLLPGPIDDLIILILGCASRKGIAD